MKLLMKVLVLLIFFTHSALFASAGKVSLLNGEAYAQRDSQKIALQNGSILEEKDVIITAKGAQVQLIFEDKTVITLGSESEFKIEEYFNDAKAPKAKFKFGQGTFKTITGQIGKTAPENFTLETKTATIGIRGTIVGGMIPPPSSPTPEAIFCLSGSIFARPLTNPTGPAVTIPAGSVTFVAQGGAPTPPRPATTQELQQINQSTGTPASTTTSSPTTGTTTPSSEESSASSEGNTPPSAPLSTPSAPQTVVPAAAASASQTNLQTNSQTQIQTIVQTQTCPAGQSGIYPNCGTCTALQTGTYPNCVDRTCEAGTTGTYPNCVPLTCGAGQSGIYPNCTDIPPIVPSVPEICPAGTTGTFPNCVSLTCPAGQSGIYPNCGTCTALQTGTYPNCVDKTCAAGTTGTYPNCVAQTCPDGMTGTPPNCTQISSPLALSGLATSSAVQSNTIQHTHDNAFTAFVTNALAEGNILLIDNTLAFNSTSVSVTSPTLFTVNISDANITQLSSVSSPVSNVLWGKWTSLEMDGNSTLMPTSDNYWVAGKIADRATAASHIASIYNDASTYTTYTYLGKSMGTVYNSSGQTFTIDPINDATNEVKLVFQFGNSGAPINNAESHVQFTANGYWNIGFYPGQAHASADGSFWAMFSSGTIGGYMKGAFYGANAESLGGTFQANNSDTSNTAVGAFVASKSGTTTSILLSGFATSINNNLYNGEVIGKSYHNEDTVNFLFTDSSYIGSGIITLDRAPSDPPIEEQIMSSSTTSVSTFGSSSDYLRWGKWTSSAVGNSNETLIASTDNFWVAGSNQIEAASYIHDLVIGTQTPILTYKGNVMGSTYESGTRYAIDEDFATNKVLLQFDLGAEDPINRTNSFITFESNGNTWSLKPVYSSLTDGIFNASFDSDFSHIANDGGSWNVSSGSLLGSFYGPSANAAGGTFQASDSDGINIALGVFKAIKTSEFYYPTSFNPALDDISAEGTFDFTGLATSEYIQGSTRYASTSDAFNLTINTINGPMINGSVTLSDSRDSFALDATTNGDDKMTYTDKNNFTIKDFDEAKGYIVTDSSESNDYVSWGYWAINSTDSSQLTTKRNYWVGGSQADANAAISHIAGLPANTHYIYNGKVLGDVEEAGWRHTIVNDASNSVQLKFDFGGGTNSLYNDPNYSWIRFTANDKQWDLKPTLTTPTVTNGTFSDGLTGTVTSTAVVPVTTGNIQGKFYGAQAQAVGGTFNAATSTAIAVGVFKAIRLGAN